MASGDILCYMHEDLCFHTLQWGRQVEKYFTIYPYVGMVGVAGTHFLADMPAACWDTEIRSGQLLQGAINNGEYKVVSQDSWLDYKKTPTVVASVDGLWMCFQRKVFSLIRWDDSLFSGFHGYDTDISLQVWNAGYEVHMFWGVFYHFFVILLKRLVYGIEFHDYYSSFQHSYVVTQTYKVYSRA